MKKLIFNFALLCTVITIFASCDHKQFSKKTTFLDTSNFVSYGDKSILIDNYLTKEEALFEFDQLELNDSTDINFESTVKSVCKVKGCWMTLALDDDNENARISFKDYSFFVPKDIEGKDVIVSGTAVKNVLSVDHLKHLAEDAGKPQEEIDAITQPEETYSFIAKRVLIRK